MVEAVELRPDGEVRSGKNSKIKRIHPQDLFRLSVQHWWQIKTNISGGSGTNIDYIDGKLDFSLLINISAGFEP